MQGDFVKRSRQRGASKIKVHAAGRSKGGATAKPMGWFLTGLVCGAFAVGLLWLASQQPEVEETMERVAEATLGPAERPKPRFDFYTLLPEQNLEVVDAAPGSVQASARKTEAQPAPARQELALPSPAGQEAGRYLLQAGSFRQAGDADSRRGELILLGLTARVEEFTTDSGRWFRVYVGPFESRSQLNRAQSLTTQSGIDTLILEKKPSQG
ncbi:MAG: SPOR domain-containing protein [Halieaceae bacterium]|nr:SPOR domain-containing protein [Halieaceae bacterium]